VAALAVQVALAAVLAIWLAPQLIGVASVGALHMARLPDLASGLAGSNDWLAVANGGLSDLARAGGALNVGPLGAFTTAQWAMFLGGVGVIWFFGNRLLLAGLSERRGNSQEAV
jgi:hypothetical protein